MLAETSLHPLAAPVRQPSPVRGCAAAHAAARDPGGDAAATIDRRASIRDAEVSHLRTSARFLLRGMRGAQTEISLAVIAYNLKRMINVLGGGTLTRELATA